MRETREAILHIRRSKSMVIDPDDPNRMSAGSFFKNPIVPNEKYDEIAARHNESVPKFNVDGTSVKIPAAWLIEQSGFKKGLSSQTISMAPRVPVAPRFGAIRTLHSVERNQTGR